MAYEKPSPGVAIHRFCEKKVMKRAQNGRMGVTAIAKAKHTCMKAEAKKRKVSLGNVGSCLSGACLGMCNCKGKLVVNAKGKSLAGLGCGAGCSCASCQTAHGMDGINVPFIGNVPVLPALGVLGVGLIAYFAFKE